MLTMPIVCYIGIGLMKDIQESGRSPNSNRNTNFSKVCGIGFRVYGVQDLGFGV